MRGMITVCDQEHNEESEHYRSPDGTKQGTAAKFIVTCNQAYAFGASSCADQPIRGIPGEVIRKLSGKGRDFSRDWLNGNSFN